MEEQTAATNRTVRTDEPSEIEGDQRRFRVLVRELLSVSREEVNRKLKQHERKKGRANKSS